MNANRNFRQRTVGLSVSLVLANIAAWVWAYLVFHDQPVLLEQHTHFSSKKSGFIFTKQTIPISPKSFVMQAGI